jgi:hypothetical protein
LESAALAIRNEAGFAAPLAGVTLGEQNISLNIAKEAVESQAVQTESGALLQLTPPPPSDQGIPGWLIGVLTVLLVIGGVYVIFKRSPQNAEATQNDPIRSRTAYLQIKHGPNAGKHIKLTKLPCHIGRDPMNDIRLDDPYVISQHAKIVASNNGYYLMDLGGETFINGKAVIKGSAVLNSGDVVRLGRSALFVFGS